MQYYIYHIPERIKIGTTYNIPQRMEQHRWDGPYEILETHTCPILAGKREIELQKEYGYPVDNRPYHIILEMGQKGLANIKDENRIVNNSDHQRRASAAAHQAKLARGIYDDIGRKKRKLTFEDAEQIRKYSNEGMSQRSIAKLYGVSQRTIAMIIHEITYKKE